MKKVNVERRRKRMNPFGTQAKLLLHFDRIHQYLTTDDSIPICMEVNLTNRCNLNCVWCISENMRCKDEIALSVIKNFLDQYKEIGGRSIIFSGGGEPTMHSDFPEIITYADSLKIDLGLMTNGVYPKKYTRLIGEKFEWVRFSLDTIDPGLYKKWKGAGERTLKQVIENIRALSEEKVRHWVNVNVSVDHSLADIKRLVEEIPKIAEGLQFRPVLPRYFKEETVELNEDVWTHLTSLPPTEKISLSLDKLEEVRKQRFFQFQCCDGHMLVPILNANGNVCVCMYQTNDPRFVFGNLYKTDFKTIWVSKRRREVIEFVRGFDYRSHCQVCCKLNEVNKFLDFIKYKRRPKDVNFI